MLGLYFLMYDPTIAIIILVMSIYHLFSWLAHRGNRFSKRAYLFLLFGLIANALFSFSRSGLVFFVLGFLTILYAVSVWISYQQLRIEEREDEE